MRTLRTDTHPSGQEGRISNLEQKLADAARAEERHREIETGLRAALSYAEGIIATVREPMLVIDGSLRVRTASRAFYYTFAVSPEETIGRLIHELGNGQWDIPALRSVLERVLPEQASFEDFEVAHDFPVLGRRVMLLNARTLRTGEADLVFIAIEDLTERKRIQEELVRSNEDWQRLAYVAAHDLRTRLNAVVNLVQLLGRRVEAKLDAQEREILTKCIWSLERLGALMRDILAYSEIGNAPQQRTVLSLEEPLNVALANLQHHIEHSGATVTVGTLPSVLVDRAQMVMVSKTLWAMRSSNAGKNRH